MDEAEIYRAILTAFDDANTDEFGRLLRAHPEFIRSKRGKDHWMWRAAIEGKLPIIQALVHLGMNVNESHSLVDDPNDQFYELEGPIRQAAGAGHLETVRWLLEHGAQINFIVHGKRRCLPLLDAVVKGHLEVVKLLVEHGADIHATWNNINAATQAEDYGQFAVRDYLRSMGARTFRETTPPDYPRAHERILKQMTKQRGPLADWRLEIPGEPLITLHLIPPNEKCDVQTLFTVGLSDHSLPRGQKEHACTELRCMLPCGWPLSDEALADPVWNWPVEWLKRLASELRAAEQWQEEPVLFMNGDPPQPLAAGTGLCGWLCLKSIGESVHAPDYRWIDIHSLFPIYAGEAELVRQAGHEELVGRFEASKIPLHVDPARSNMAGELGQADAAVH